MSEPPPSSQIHEQINALSETERPGVEQFRVTKMRRAGWSSALWLLEAPNGETMELWRQRSHLAATEGTRDPHDGWVAGNSLSPAALWSVCWEASPLSSTLYRTRRELIEAVCSVWPSTPSDRS